MRTAKIYPPFKPYITSTYKFLNRLSALNATQWNTTRVIQSYIVVNSTFEYIELDYKQITDIISIVLPSVRNTKQFRAKMLDDTLFKQYSPERMTFQDLFNPIVEINKSTVRFYFTKLAFDSFVNIANFEGE